jgi:sugar-phosphatase
VWEDSIAGVEAAVAAGSDVMIISATHQKRLETEHPMMVDYHGVGAVVDDLGRLALTKRQP